MESSKDDGDENKMETTTRPQSSPDNKKQVGWKDEALTDPSEALNDDDDDATPPSAEVSNPGNDHAVDEQDGNDTPAATEMMNPQEAVSLPSAIEFTTASSATNEAATEQQQQQEDATRKSAKASPKENNDVREGWKKRKKRKRGRARLAALDGVPNTGTTKVPSDARDNSTSLPFTAPKDQYEVVLRRRAIRKASEQEQSSSTRSATTASTSSPLTLSLGKTPPEAAISEEDQDDDDDNYDEEYGDISLGMKLSIISGKVIVQSVNPLSDGRASPAQLAGKINRGDIILSIDGKSVYQLPPPKLVVRLSPLSSTQPDGTYKRVLRLRFVMREGLALMEKSEQSKAGTPEIFSLQNLLTASSTVVPLVDQLSGMPLFDATTDISVSEATKSTKSESVTASVMTTTSSLPAPVVPSSIEPKILTIDDIISIRIADLYRQDKERIVSEFFAWKEAASVFLQAPVTFTVRVEDISNDKKTRTQVLNRGHVATKGAKVLFYSMEDIDKGKDLRSFKVWSTTLSLRSRASTRRRFVMDGASLMGGSSAGYGTINEDLVSDAGASIGSSEMGEFDGLTGDDILLQLAAHDEIWRRQVLETIEKARKEMDEDENNDAAEKENNNTDAALSVPDLDSSLSNTLGSFLLGNQVNQLITKKKRSFALPPEEVTSVLFDLVTSLASATPDEISVKGGFNLNPQTSLVPFQTSKKSPDENTRLATRFVLEDVFPAWLASFKPLQWEERRVLWPYTRATNATTDSITGSMSFMSGDDLTLDSTGSGGFPSPNARNDRKRSKDLREIIEDMELDVESRAETCFLLSFYFTREILPRVSKDGEDDDAVEQQQQHSLAFIDRYGAYLKLPMSLAYAAYLHAEPVVDKLLSLAKHDLRHREALKETAKQGVLVLYEATMLSAIMKRIQSIREERKSEKRSHLIDLCVAAYPDLPPWLVKRSCIISTKNSELERLYYRYLSFLLHPLEGNDVAKRDESLVNEWAKLSTVSSPSDHNSKPNNNRSDRFENFMRVASRKHPDHEHYRRDLVTLMDLSVRSGENGLFLDLADEALDKASLAKQERVVSKMLEHLRVIGAKSLHAGGASSNSSTIDLQSLSKTIALFQKTARDGSASKGFINVGQELFGLLQVCADNQQETRTNKNPSQKETDLLAILSERAQPHHVLEALLLWSPHQEDPSHSLQIVQQSVWRGAKMDGVAYNNEMSGSLFRIHSRSIDKKQHQSLHEKDDQADVSLTTDNGSSIWRKVMKGTAKIEK